MRRDFAHIVLGSVDEARLALAQKGQAQHIESRRVDDAAIVAQVAPAVEEPLDADDRVQLQQRQRDRRVVQVHRAVADPVLHRRRQRRRVDLQADGQRGPRAHARSDPAVRRAGDRLVQVQRIAPERLIAERVEPERLPALVDQFLARVVAVAIDRARRGESGGAQHTDRTDGEYRRQPSAHERGQHACGSRSSSVRRVS